MDPNFLNHANTLRSYLSQFTTIPDGEWQKLQVHLKVVTIEDGESFLRAGDEAEYLGFVLKGLLRKYFLSESGREFIKDFSEEGRIVAGYSSLLKQKPSRLFIQAIELSLLLVIPYKKFTALYSEHVCWQELGRKIAEGLYIEREHREWQLLLFSAKKRYAFFKEARPQLIQRVPQYQIASYLGISPVSLSRLLGKSANSEK